MSNKGVHLLVKRILMLFDYFLKICGETTATTREGVKAGRNGKGIYE